MSDGRRAGMSRQYPFSLPERALRSMSALSAGLLRELSEVVLPRAVRRTRLYTELVENTLRFLIENVGQVEGAYPPQGKLADNFAMGRLARTANTPPLDVASLRREWSGVRREAAKIPTPHLPPGEALGRSWEELKTTAAAQGRPVFQISTLMALSAVSRIPGNLLWLSRCAKGAARRTGQILAGVLLDHYGATMQEIRSTGYVAYWVREFRPYLKAAASQFSPRRVTLTERMLRGARS